MIEKKYQNDEAGEDDPDVDDESLENISVLLPALPLHWIEYDL